MKQSIPRRRIGRWRLCDVRKHTSIEFYYYGNGIIYLCTPVRFFSKSLLANHDIYFQSILRSKDFFDVFFSIFERLLTENRPQKSLRSVINTRSVIGPFTTRLNQDKVFVNEIHWFAVLFISINQFNFYCNCIRILQYGVQVQHPNDEFTVRS